MADWQGELEALLARLNVSLDSRSLTQREMTAEPPELEAGSMELEDSGELARTEGPESDPLWSAHFIIPEEPPEHEEVSAVRSEIEATVHQIVELARAGRIDKATRDDVIFVLRALTRPRPEGPRLRVVDPVRGGEVAESAQEWQLDSAAAVLRFCRIVSHLTNGLIADGGR
jgi:hypothetical protein